MKKKNEIKPVTNMPENKEPLTPGWVRVLEGYLRGYAPARTPGKGVIMRSSAEIVSELEDMADISVMQVTDVMAACGYKAWYSPGGGHGWLMEEVGFRDPRDRLLAADGE